MPLVSNTLESKVLCVENQFRCIVFVPKTSLEMKL